MLFKPAISPIIIMRFFGGTVNVLASKRYFYIRAIGDMRNNILQLLLNSQKAFLYLIAGIRNKRYL